MDFFTNTPITAIVSLFVTLLMILINCVTIWRKSSGRSFSAMDLTPLIRQLVKLQSIATDLQRKQSLSTTLKSENLQDAEQLLQDSVTQLSVLE